MGEREAMSIQPTEPRRYAGHDWDTTPVENWLMNAGLGSSKSVLDVGCRDGQFCELFTQLGFQTVGLDVYDSPFRSPAVRFVQKSVFDMDESADIVFSSDMIQHLWNPLQALWIINKSAKNLIIISTDVHGELGTGLVMHPDGPVDYPFLWSPVFVRQAMEYVGMQNAQVKHYCTLESPSGRCKPRSVAVLTAVPGPPKRFPRSVL